ncbi:SAM-dependent methyltransferase [Dactylosporangium sp. NBC_01737]|uniref:SAM-dependent methyltransferase n=1 Tax=Dactylosporangium sp. NBC_01737 TaxID=2975959 RepID=UPI002E0FCB13|nr:SAM-dependent methyltransferase [Dactylosporangium sp. NBC_01737]
MTTPPPALQPPVGGAAAARMPIDTSVAHPARRYDYLLGGKDNFASDRDSAERLITVFPPVQTAAVENRRFLRRLVRYLAAEAGVTQFLDIGTGIPTSPNVHEIAQGVTPDARVVYVDNDPIVMTHARALLTSYIPGTTAYIEADLRDPGAILGSPDLRRTLDFTQPIALLFVAVLHFLPDDDHPYEAVSELADAMPPGSFLTVSHATFDPLPDDVRQRLTAMADPAAGHGPFRPRSHPEVARFFDGADLLEPGLVSIVEWHPDEHPRPEATAAEAIGYAAVARLP